MNVDKIGNVKVINILIRAKEEEEKKEYVNTVSTNRYTPLIISAAKKMDPANALLVLKAKPAVKHNISVTASESSNHVVAI